MSGVTGAGRRRRRDRASGGGQFGRGGRVRGHRCRRRCDRGRCGRRRDRTAGHRAGGYRRNRWGRRDCAAGLRAHGDRRDSRRGGGWVRGGRRGDRSKCASGGRGGNRDGGGDRGRRGCGCWRGGGRGWGGCGCRSGWRRGGCRSRRGGGRSGGGRWRVRWSRGGDRHWGGDRREDRQRQRLGGRRVMGAMRDTAWGGCATRDGAVRDRTDRGLMVATETGLRARDHVVDGRLAAAEALVRKAGAMVSGDAAEDRLLVVPGSGRGLCRGCRNGRGGHRRQSQGHDRSSFRVPRVQSAAFVNATTLTLAHRSASWNL